LDGQRALSAGGSQEGVWATAAPDRSRAASTVLSVKGFMVVLPDFLTLPECDRCRDFAFRVGGNLTLSSAMAADFLYRPFSIMPAGASTEKDRNQKHSRSIADRVLSRGPPP
jgi:hypothetical protein